MKWDVIRGVIAYPRRKMKTWWVCNAVAEPVDDEELGAIDGGVAEGMRISPGSGSDDDVAADDADE